MLHLFTRMVSKFGLSVGQASYVYNTFLLPKLDLGLRYICGAQADGWVRSYDAILVGSIKHAAASPLRLSHSAVALTSRFTLPSWLEVAIKASELFIRMNSTGCRWGQLGRRLMRLQVGGEVQRLPHQNKRRSGSSRLERAVALAVNELQWKLQLREEPSRRVLHSFDQPPAGPLPDTIDQSSCTSRVVLSLTPPVSTRAVHDCWTGWGATLPARTVHVYSDGSFRQGWAFASSSAWAVTVRDEWLCSNFARLPTDEHLLTRADVGDATQFGAAITCTTGVYAAELQAIARTLAMFPASCTLHVHSDSQGALAGIRAYLHECNARRRLRMSARPLLQLIAHLLAVREQVGGAVHWHHVKAHSQNSDIDSVGNRLTDWMANQARTHPGSQQPLPLRELPLDKCEHFLTVWQHQHTRREQQLIDDPRRSALTHLKAAALSKWCARRDAPQHVMCDGALADAGMLDLSRIVLAAGSSAQQATLINVATNSIQCAWTTAADNTQHVRPLDCPDCPDVACSLGHLAECAGTHATRFRSNLRSDIFAVLDSTPCTAAWRRQQGRDDLQQILLRLFPMIAFFVPSEEKHLHFTRLLCGAFTARQANVAAKSLGFPSAEDGRPTLQRIRLACLDRIAQVFSDLKRVAAP
jgi:ribonuclease HI